MESGSSQVFLERIVAVIQGVQIHAVDEYAWFGQREGRLPAPIRRALDASGCRAHLVRQLQQRLYKSFYRSGYARRQIEQESLSDPGGDPEFVNRLSIANAGKGSWMPGWTVRAVADDTVVIQRGDLELCAAAACCRAADPSAVREGAAVEVLLPKEQLGISPGYYMVLSDRAYAVSPAVPRLRIYWHISANGGERLVREVSSRMNRSGTAFRFKILNDTGEFTRCDAAVLYLYRSEYARTRETIAAIYRELASWMQPETPAFTKRLAPGLAVAEDPADGSSFGVTRSELLAEGIVRMHERKARSLATRLEIVRQAFQEKGISFETAYLNAGSTDVYATVGAPPPRPAGNQAEGSTLPAPDTTACLDTARELADLLTRSAYRHGDRCTWMFLDGAARRLSHGPETCITAGASLYDGTAGIALFLSELGRVTADAPYRDLALCAIRHAVTRLDDVPETVRHGLYAGWFGAALAAARIGIVDELPWLVRSAREIVDRIAPEHGACREYDVINGLSGAILALLAMARLLDVPQYVAISARLGDRLVSLATRCDRGSSWVTPGRSAGQPNLTGYSHGTAGASHALFELFSMTGNDRYREVADQACAYEDSWYCGKQANWPDLREQGDRSKRQSAEYPFISAWCHGAPGIAIARARAYEITHRERYSAVARSALQTTEQSLQSLLGSQELCLCHGLLGNTEILAHGQQILSGNRLSDNGPLIDGIMGTVQHRLRMEHGSAHKRVGKSGPGMMTGMSGIGYALLRRCDDELPSMLDVSGWNR